MTSDDWSFSICGNGEFRSFGIAMYLQRNVVDSSDSSSLVMLVSETKKSKRKCVKVRGVPN